jgi:hypothetical protein
VVHGLQGHQTFCCTNDQARKEEQGNITRGAESEFLLPALLAVKFSDLSAEKNIKFARYLRTLTK